VILSTNDKIKNKNKKYCTVVIVSHFNKKIQETEVKLTPIKSFLPVEAEISVTKV
jgi:hypothetical protein